MKRSLLTLTICVLALSAQDAVGASMKSSRLSDEVLHLQLDVVPDRPRPLLELGDKFLSTGEIQQGITLPTRANWQPSFIVWGSYRTAFQAVDIEDRDFSEWANRLDLFGNLYLTPTERLLIGFRPLDQNGRFTRYTFKAPDAEDEDFEDEYNVDVTTFFFEGDFGELFPLLDWRDGRGLDVAFSVGRQPISFQNGMLINDTIDALGVSKINLRTGNAVNHRGTLLWGWDEINRSNLARDDESAALFGFFNEVDWRPSTVSFDLVYVDADDETGDGFHGGLSAVQRMGGLNSTFRVLGSWRVGDETEHNRTGVLLFSELSRTRPASDDFIYLNGYWAIDEFRSASRGPSNGGPLAPAGVLYEAVGLGRYGSALDSTADDAVGGAMGYQLFLNGIRSHLIFEFGGRYATEDVGQRAVAAGATYQAALGQRTVFRLDGFSSYGRERTTTESSGDEVGIGGRIELSCQF